MIRAGIIWSLFIPSWIRRVLQGLPFLVATSMCADPINFMVDDLTFIRPPAWQWVELDSSSKIAAQLRIPYREVNTNILVTFSLSGTSNPPSAALMVSVWMKSFQAPEGGELLSETNKITFAKRQLTYLQVQADHKIMEKGELKRIEKNSAFAGAIIEGGKRNLFIYMNGPRALIKESTGAFKEMIESALKE